MAAGPPAEDEYVCVERPEPSAGVAAADASGLIVATTQASAFAAAPGWVYIANVPPPALPTSNSSDGAAGTTGTRTGEGEAPPLPHPPPPLSPGAEPVDMLGSFDMVAAPDDVAALARSGKPVVPTPVAVMLAGVAARATDNDMASAAFPVDVADRVAATYRVSAPKPASPAPRTAPPAAHSTTWPTSPPLPTTGMPVAMPELDP